MLKEIGKMFCVSLIDYASNDTKVREAIQELETLFPPPKAEEGLSLQYGPPPQGDKGESNKNENAQ
jgi:hypothetical protein